MVVIHQVSAAAGFFRVSFNLSCLSWPCGPASTKGSCRSAEIQDEFGMVRLSSQHTAMGVHNA